MTTMKKAKKIKEEKPKEEVSRLEGLEQEFINKKGKTVKLKKVLGEKDWWELKKQKYITYIVTHNGVKRIAEEAGILKTPQYVTKVEGTYSNNGTWVVECTVTNSK